MKKKVKRVRKHPVLHKITTVLSLMLVAVIVICFCSIITTKHIYHQPASLFGYRMVKILTDSMEPNIHANTYIWVKRVDGNDVKVGDYVVYLPAYGELAGTGVTITHCCIEEAHYVESVGRVCITTQGTKAGAPVDEPVPVENVQSVYLSSIHGSELLDFVTSKWGIVVLIAIPCLAGIILQIVSMIKAVKDNPDEEKVKEAVEQLEQERIEKLKKEAVETYLAQQSVLEFLARQKAQSAPQTPDDKVEGDTDGGGDGGETST